jgi:predicted metal-dependent hydrolase
MQLDFLFKPLRIVEQTRQHSLTIGTRNVPIQFIRNHRARRYILRMKPDGSVRATVPGRGSIKQAQAFAERNIEWIAKQLQKHQQQSARPHVWQHGTEIFYRGELVQLNVGADHDGNSVTFGDQAVRVSNAANVRPTVERHLWRMAARELTERTIDLAAQHNIIVQRITVRNQRSRWGSCSRRGTISLNWRLIQSPAFVQDYTILHELMHRREANHSKRYWQQVAVVCPDYKKAEVWLKQHRGLLH